ncbi:DUF2946 family protein [Caldimonas brevitalea]|uniref:DUF2946 domain-containing protein n=1 Tax=Caldimonas brevitalea TaxID=413882 RepID=A0A0G3BP60_9BURK|nr:DUF2946 family protein [Caldimonas brevitalea]AKJ29156.1 hypothetical protein AAW51_2465 [Caldimonas brevitalea]
MPGTQRLFTSRSALRLATAWWLVLVVFWQPWAAAYQATVAVAGLELCSVAGTQRVDRHGNSVDADHAHVAGDCCAAADLSLPPAAISTLTTAQIATRAAPLLTAGRIGAEWLGALSRGPPTRS